MPKLYDNAASGNCYKVRLLLAHLGTEYETVPIDIFTGESRAPEHLARNPAARTPVWETDEGEFLPESAAIMLYLARGTQYLPDEPLAAARVTAWMFFEQNLLEPNVGTGRFWHFAGAAQRRPEAYERFREAGKAALDVLERRLGAASFAASEDYTVADMALYAYTHVAGDIGLELLPATRAWIARVEAQPGFVNDLAPYPDTVASRPD